jgi:hypothetical protein
MFAAGLVAASTLPPAVAARDRLALDRVELGLPGPPAAFFGVDADRDGVGDLAVVVAFSSWEQSTSSELGAMEGVDGVVEVLTVIPELADRRELHLFRGLPEGGYRTAAEVLVLGAELRSLASAGPAGPLLALTDTGVAELVFGLPTAAEAAEEALALPADPASPTGSAGDPAAGFVAGPRWHFAPRLAAPPALAGARELLGELPFVFDLDGDALPDLLLPTDAGLAVHLATRTAEARASLPTAPAPTGDQPPRPAAHDGGDPAADPSASAPQDEGSARDLPALAWSTQPSAVLAYPAVEQASPRRWVVPLPDVRDLDADGLPEIVLRGEDRRGQVVAVWRNLGGGRFAPPWRLDRAVAAAQLLPKGEGELVWLGDLDGDGWGEVVLQDEQELPDDAGMRAELRHAKSPPFEYHRVPLRRGADGGLALDVAARQRFAARGWALGASDDGGFRVPVSSGFQDLDGDGRQDLVALDLDFSLFQGLKVLTVQRISLGIDFRVLCQEPGGGFREVAGLDLAGTFKLSLRDLAVGTLVQFAGDFDGDGRADFVQMGRGRKVGIHRGQPGCRYPARPDLEIELAAPATDLGAVEVRELDGDGRADLLLVQARRRSPGETGEGASLPVRLDLYLSRGRS